MYVAVCGLREDVSSKPPPQEVNYLVNYYVTQVITKIVICSQDALCLLNFFCCGKTLARDVPDVEITLRHRAI